MRMVVREYLPPRRMAMAFLLPPHYGWMARTMAFLMMLSRWPEC